MSYEQNQAEKDEANQLIARQTMMETDRSTTENHWQECMQYILPRKNDINTTRTPGDKRGQELFDSTAINANQTLANSLHGILTNPASRFFVLEPSDPTQQGDEIAKWLDDTADRMFNVLNASNFQTEVHEYYIDLPAIGNACFFTGEHDERVVHFNARAMKEIYAQENNLGLIDIVHRKFHWKPRQVIQAFGEKNLPEKVVKDHKDGCNDNWTIIHAVEPAEEEYSKASGPKEHKFKSRYLLKDEGCFLSKDGFREFPYAVGRWTKLSGEVYGRGPGQDALADIKMVNAMMESTLRGGQLAAEPPFMVPDDGVIGKVRLTPRGVTVVRAGFEIKELVTNSRVDYGFQLLKDVRDRIRAAFFVDQLQLNEGPQMTAAEVYQRTEEKSRLMGPVLGRQHFEFLKPVIERVYRIMERKKMFLPPPAGLTKGFEVRYSSLMARAQRMSDGQNFTRAIQTLGPIVQAQPEVLDNINGDKALTHIMDIFGVTPKILNSSRDVANKRDARSKMQQQQMQMQQQQHEADVAGKVLPGAAQMAQAQKAPA